MNTKTEAQRIQNACAMMQQLATEQREDIQRLEQRIHAASKAGEPTAELECELAEKRLSLDTLEQVIAENC